MKQGLITIITIFISFSIVAQELITSEFDRPSITCLYLDKYSSDDNRLSTAFRQINPGDKFFINDLGFYGYDFSFPQQPIDVSQERKKYSSKENKGFLHKIVLGNTAILEPRDSFGIMLGQTLQQKFNLGGKVMAGWAERDGSGNFVKINERSDYNLNSNDLREKADEHKLENYKSLLFKNYILVYDLGESTETGMVRVNNDNGKHNMLFSVYVYKVDISDEIFGKILAPNFKNQSFLANYEFPLTYVGRFIDDATVSETDYDIKANLQALSKGFKKKEKTAMEAKSVSQTSGQRGYLEVKVSKDTIYKDLMQSGFDITMNLCEKQVEDFKVRTMLVGRMPLQAEIGRREGLRADQRYFVYQYKQNSNGELNAELKGIVRAVGPIADNLDSRKDKDGNYLRSNFKQTYGDLLKEGMFMVQNNSLGAKFAVGLGLKNHRLENISSIPTFEVRFEYSFSDWLADAFSTKKHLYGFGGFIGVGIGRVGLPEEKDGHISSLQLNFGISKNLYFSRKMDLVPYVAFVSEQISGKTDQFRSDGFDEQLQYLDLGCRAVIPITSRFGLEPTISLPIGTSKVNSDVYYQGPIHFTLNGLIEF